MYKNGKIEENSDKDLKITNINLEIFIHNAFD